MISLFFTSGCALIEDFRSPEIPVSRHQKQDYLDQLNAIGNQFIQLRSHKVIKFSEKHQQYLLTIFKSIVKSNPKLTSPKKDPEFYLIHHKAPFFFAFPSGMYFFSSGLLKKYVKHEQILFSILSYETFRYLNQMYVKHRIVPLHNYDEQKVLSLLRISLQARSEVHKWAVYLMKNTGYDPYAYLMWLQTMNRNSVDFSMYLGGSKDIAKEEYLFKSFMAKEIRTFDSNESFDQKNSSKQFYRFVNEIKR